MKKPRNKKKKPSCGTQSGYRGHLRRGERPCKICLIGSDTYAVDEIQTLIYDFRDWSRDQQLWRAYRLSIERFAQIFAEQGNRCGCCSATDPGDASWHVDHDHRTGAIRGILCSGCNTGIGQLGDDLEGLQRAVTYLQAHAARGGHAQAKEPPKQQIPEPKPSRIMRRCFDLFRQGVPQDQVVIILRLTPDAVKDAYDLWKKADGKISPLSRHIFQITKETPQRLVCSCGYAPPWNSSNDVSEAVEHLNQHIKKANTDHEAEWALLAIEEKNRREAQDQRIKEDHRRRVANELQLARLRKEAQGWQKKCLQLFDQKKSAVEVSGLLKLDLRDVFDLWTVWTQGQPQT